MLCMSCGHVSSQEAGTCENCGAHLKKPLPKSERERVGPPPYNGAPYRDLVRWCREYELRSIGKEELLRRLDKRESFYEERRRAVTEYDAPDDVKELAREELRVGLLGIEGLIGAVRGLRVWLEGGDAGAKDKALQLAEQSARLMHRAMTLNCESMNTLIDSAEQFLQEHDPNVASPAGAGDNNLGFIGGMNITGF